MNLVFQASTPAFFCGACGPAVKALDQRSKGLGFDSAVPVMCTKPWASSESTVPLSTQQRWVPGARSKVGSTVLDAPVWLRCAKGGKESAEHACMDIRL